MKKIVLTGGGSAGHVTPNIALVPKLRELGYDILYIGSKKGIEKELIQKENIEFKSISSGKLRRYFDIKNFTDPFRVIKGLFDARKILKKYKPDVVFSKGGFVTVPVVIAAHMLKIPVVIHESDISPGLANKISSKYAKKICYNFPETLGHISKDKAVLTGSPITDMRITLLVGRAHLKHTEGGDFRQATYRAIRQGLMEAKKQGDCRLLEPWYGFRLEVPQDMVGHAMADVQRMGGTFETPSPDGEYMVLDGTAPVAEMQDYAMDVNAYTHGRGHLSCVFAGYCPCHNADEVIENAAYDPEADLENTPDSVFCAHGAGYPVKWYKVPEFMHLGYAWSGMGE